MKCRDHNNEVLDVDCTITIDICNELTHLTKVYRNQHQILNVDNTIRLVRVEPSN